MKQLLNKLGQATFRYPGRVLAIWLLLLTGLGGIAYTQYQPMSSAITIPGTEAQQALERFDELFPEAGEGSARIVFATNEGRSIDDQRKVIDQVTADVRQVSGVSQAITPFDNPTAISKDKRIAYSQIQLDKGVGEVDKSTTEGIAAIVAEANTKQLQIEIGGDAISKVPEEIVGFGEVTGVLIALGVLVVALGAIVAAGLPIIVALVTVGVGAGGLFALSQFIDITSTTPVLAIMIGLAVGIDYSLFIISKYRQHLLEGYDYQDAAGKATASAGGAVLFAAATVVIALAALAIVQIPFMTTMGLAGAATVALAGLAAVTLLPALLGIVKSKIFRGKTRQAIERAIARGPRDSVRISRQTIWNRWGEFTTKRPVLVVVVAVMLVGSLALPARSLELGLPSDEFAATHSTERKAYDLLAEGFGEGYNGPLLVVAENLPKVSQADKAKVRQSVMAEYEKEAAKQTAQAKAKLEKQASQISSPAEMQAFQQKVAQQEATAAKEQAAAKKKLAKQIDDYSQLYQLNQLAEEINRLDNVASALPASVTDSGREGVIQVIPDSSPSSTATHELVDNLRQTETQRSLGKDLSLSVTGSTALQMDVDDKLARSLPVYLSVVIGLSLVLLAIAFRSILIPIKATLGFLLSVFAMFGAVVAVYQWGWFGLVDNPGPIVSFIPIISIGVLFGLAMDYEFFIVSSIHEEYERTQNAKQSIINGFSLGSKVVTAAGLIMVAVFAGFIGNDDASIRAIGFGLAFGILIDAFIVRMMIVPAVMTLLGKSAWWLPGRRRSN